MKYKNMNVAELKRIVNYLFEEGSKAVIITLIDGNSICGLLPPHFQRFYDGEFRNVEPQDCCYSGDELILVDRRQHKEKEYRIPFNKIAGICDLSYSQKEYHIDSLGRSLTREKTSDIIEGKYCTSEGFENILLDNLYTSCKKYGFTISVFHALYYRMIPKPFAWGELRVKSGFPIYADWDYISHMSRGITSIGAGVLAVSGSIGWEKSLYGIRKQLMEKSIQRLDSISQSEIDPVVIRTFVDTIRLKKGNKMTTPYEIIEGEKWFPVILSENKIGNSDNPKPKGWCVGYMKEKCIMVPKSVFESIQEPLIIQGEMMPIPVKTSFGTCEYSIRIRNISAT